MMSQVVTYQLKPPRVPKTSKKTPVAQTVPLSTLPLPGTYTTLCSLLVTEPRVDSQHAPSLHPGSHLPQH